MNFKRGQDLPASAAAATNSCGTCRCSSSSSISKQHWILAFLNLHRNLRVWQCCQHATGRHLQVFESKIHDFWTGTSCSYASMWPDDDKTTRQASKQNSIMLASFPQLLSKRSSCWTVAPVLRQKMQNMNMSLTRNMHDL